MYRGGGVIDLGLIPEKAKDFYWLFFHLFQFVVVLIDVPFIFFENSRARMTVFSTTRWSSHSLVLSPPPASRYFLAKFSPSSTWTPWTAWANVTTWIPLANQTTWTTLTLENRDILSGKTFVKKLSWKTLSKINWKKCSTTTNLPQKTIHSDNLQNMIQSHNLQTRCCQDQQGVAEMLSSLREKCFENLEKEKFK